MPPPFLPDATQMRPSECGDTFVSNPMLNSNDNNTFNRNEGNLKDLKVHRKIYTIFELFYMIKLNLIECFPHCKIHFSCDCENYQLLHATKLLKIVTILNTYLLVERYEELCNTILANTIFVSTQVIEVLTSNNLMTELCEKIHSTFAGSEMIKSFPILQIYNNHFRIETEEFKTSVESLMKSVIDITHCKRNRTKGRASLYV